METSSQLPHRAGNEAVCNEYINTIASLSPEERQSTKESAVQHFGRFAEIICEPASIKADAPSLLEREGK